MKSTLRSILFDLDDTLIRDDSFTLDSLRRVGEAGLVHGLEAKRLTRDILEVAEELWASSPFWELGERLGIVAAECLWGDFSTPGCPWEELRAWALDFRQKVFLQALRQQGLEDVQLASELSDFFIELRRGRQRLLPDARELLQELSGTYRLGLVTNGAPDLQREKLTASGLEPFFSAVVVSGELGIGKPRPEIFHAAIEALGTKPSEALMVGNSLRRDIAGAQASGLRSIWIEIPGSEETAAATPDFTIHHLVEIRKILAELT